ncbi:MAG: alpha/beta fold hydrolase [Halomonadaceae bacterium]|nr:MAG: alpha/beta fold hydrolase [Halomonadaceae bacterium]
MASTDCLKSSFTAPFSPPAWLRNHHLQTVWPTLFRKVDPGTPRQERLITDDGDFLDLDWYRGGHRRLLIISHGLEGNARRPYVLGLARAALAGGFDVLAWNFRSCSGVMNKLPRFYHSGASDDLGRVVNRALDDPAGYDRVQLAGFSMGGNMTLVYLGEQGSALDGRIAGAVTFSVPCDLAGSAARLAEPGNQVYMRRFLKELRVKMAAKKAHFPTLIDTTGMEKMKNFLQFDEQFTAPLHGFAGARDYWERCSSQRFLGDIQTPTLIVNAADDPFLSATCYPYQGVAGNPHLRLEVPRWGGHVGFVSGPRGGHYWSEERAMAFLQSSD